MPRLTLVACVVTTVLVPVRVAVAQDEWESLPIEIHGLVEAATASRITGDRTQPDDLVLSEVRFRLDVSHYGDRSELSFKGDFTADGVTEDVEIDIRQAAITMHLADWLDLRAGRQVLTWGTGDLVFLNDLFPKDFVSFFIGREDEFLKAPSNAMKFTVYTAPLSFDFVWTPMFEPDRFITGERLSYFDPSVPGLVSATTMGQPLQSLPPSKELKNGEFAARIFRTVGGYELSLYGYVGLTKQPAAFDVTANLPAHSKLKVYGASVRGGLLGGIANLEGAYYDSPDDRGIDPRIPNSQVRALTGYERELAPNLTAGTQYYLEWTADHDGLIANSATPQFEQSEFRHTVTTRLTYRMRQETLTASVFGLFSTNDGDVHLRPSLVYKWSDAVTATAGANIMAGDEATFFGQLENNSNAYLRLRYSF